MQTAVIYARYSSSAQNDASIEQQINECQSYAKSNKLSIIDIYSDRALSGRTDDRPSFQNMVYDASKGKFDNIIFYKTDRFARNRNDAALYRTRFKRYGVKLHFAAEPIPDEPIGIVLESMLDGFAEYYSANLAQNVKRGMDDNARQCKVNGPVPLGYYRDKEGFYAIEQSEAVVVKEIFQRYVSGEPIKSIIDDITERGYRSKQGKVFRHSSILQIIMNERYTGVYIYKDIRVDGGIPAIVSKKLYQQAQQRRNSRARVIPKREGSPFMLTGKAYCGLCGTHLKGDAGTGRSGQVYRYYACGNKKRKKTCDKTAVPKEYLEKVVIDATQDLLSNQSNLSEIEKDILHYQDHMNVDSKTNSLETQLKDVERELNNYAKAIGQGVFNDTTQEKMLALEERKRQLSISISKEKMNIDIITKKDLEIYLSRLQETQDVDKLINSFVNCVIVYEDHVKILFNYKPNPRKRKFKEVCKLLDKADLLSSSSTRTAPPRLY